MAKAGERLLDVLEAINKLGACTIMELHVATGLSRQAIYRIVEVLTKTGFTDYISGTNRVRLTSKVLLLSIGYRADNALRDAAQEAVDKLQSDIGWPTSVSVYEGGAMVVVHTTQHRSPYVFTVGGIGLRLPILESAMGLAYLSFSQSKRRRMILDLLFQDQSRQDKARSIKTIELTAKKAREVGYCVRQGGIGQTTTSIALPLMKGEEVCGALCATFLHSALRLDQARKKLLPRLTDARKMAEANLMRQ